MYISLNKIKEIETKLPALCEMYNIPKELLDNISFADIYGDNTYCVVGYRNSYYSPKAYRFTFDIRTRLMNVEKLMGRDKHNNDQWKSIAGFKSIMIDLDHDIQASEGDVFFHRFVDSDGIEREEYLYAYSVNHVEVHCYIIPKDEIVPLLKQFMRSKGFGV